MNSVTLTGQLGYKKDLWSKFHKDPRFKHGDRHNLESPAPKFTADPRFTVLPHMLDYFYIISLF